MKVPNYLKDYKDLWEKDPHQANLEWWKNAKYGMFIHYGLYSMLGKDAWVQFKDQIPVAEYAKIAPNFTAHNFDADYITELACENGMNYINMVTCHHDGFCMWNSKTEPFNAFNSGAKRDLVAEMAEQCDKKGLGFITYYTFMQNWKHPYFITPEIFPNARPHYATPQPEYLYKNKEDFAIYIDYIKKCIKELLTQYGNTAAIWFDIFVAGFPLEVQGFLKTQEIYDYIREIRPDIMIAWKQGVTGTEDFAAPEQHFHSMEDHVTEKFGKECGLMCHNAWESNKVKHNDINATMQDGAWGFDVFKGHRTPDYCYELLGHSIKNNANLTLNVGPFSDGSICPIQENIIKEVGKMIKEKGYPQTGYIKANKTEYGN